MPADYLILHVYVCVCVSVCVCACVCLCVCVLRGDWMTSEDDKVIDDNLKEIFK